MRAVGHAGIVENLAKSHETKLFIHAELVGLGGEVKPVLARGAREVHRRQHHRLGDAAIAPALAHGDAADLGMFGQVR